MMTKNGILVFYACMVPSWIPVFKEWVRLGHQVDVVHWDHLAITPYVPPALDGIKFHSRSNFQTTDLKRLIDDIKPAIMFVSGWVDKGYLSAAMHARSHYDCPVVCGFDDWWKGTLRQRVGSLIPNWFRRKIFSHGWVSGPRQYEFCKRLGFVDEEIIFNFLTCDVEHFKRVDRATFEKVFLYVGRFSKEKGIADLAKGFDYYRRQLGGTWKLHCVGNGPLKDQLGSIKGLKIFEFCAPDDLLRHFHTAGAFVLASTQDYSPLVVHEAVCAGRPLIISSNVGNLSTYAVNEFNGFIFPSGDWRELAKIMKRFEKLPAERRDFFGENSVTLSQRSTPEIAAASFISVM